MKGFREFFEKSKGRKSLHLSLIDASRGLSGRPLDPFGRTPLQEVSNENKILGFFYSKEFYK